MSLAITTHSPQLEVGDIVFTRIGSFLFGSISKASLCWSNHVGIIVGHNGKDYIVAESRIPLSTTTTLTRFIARSVKGGYAVRRLKQTLTDKEKLAICAQAASRLNIFYHTGFDHDSKRQFCSKFVYEVYHDALGVEVGKIETFSELLKTNPAASLAFWKVWFFGRIPWVRRTVTPASLWNCQKLDTIIDTYTPHIKADHSSAA